MIIQNYAYIENENAVIDDDEYKETVENIQKIKKEVTVYIDDYCGHIRKDRMLHEKEFKRRYAFSPLKYFHKELGI